MSGEGTKRPPPLFLPGLVLALVVTVIDQIVKWQVLSLGLRPGDSIEVTSFFNLAMVHNRGVSFGLFNRDWEFNALVLSLVAIAISIGMLVWLWRTTRKSIAAAVGLVVGGAIGNVIDRALYGAVIDFLDFHALGYHWPAFNVADSAISIGAVILVFDALFGSAETPKKEP
jgi:signal peptidase II